MSRQLTFPIQGKAPTLFELEYVRSVCIERGISGRATLSIDEVAQEVHVEEAEDV